MNKSAVKHLSYLPFMQAHARNRLAFRLLAASGDLTGVTLCWFKRSAPEERFSTKMRAVCDDGLQTEWRCTVQFPVEAHYIKYCFLLRDAEGECYYDENGFFESYPSEGYFELLQVQESEIPSAPAWAQGCVYYQIFPERFQRSLPARRSYEAWDAAPTRDNFLGGDLPGITEKLPYLKSLGVECLYLTPVFKADFNHKYATTDYFSIDPDFGSEADLVHMVEEAHRLGIRVLLDGVFNHVGVHFAPFEDVLKNGRASRYAKWFFLKEEPLRIDPACYECVGDYPYMPRLRVAEPQVRAYVLGVLRYWLERAHIDGWRFDVADELDIRCVRWWREQLKPDFPDALFLGETWRDAVPMLLDGDAFDSAMNYLFRDAALAYFAHERIGETEFCRRIEHMRMKYPDELLKWTYNPLGSHDTPRFLTECGGDLRRMKLALAFQLCFPGAPALYYGDELGMRGENDPGCRGGMAWDHEGDSPLLDELKGWIQLRNAHEALRRGSFRWLMRDDARHLIAFERESDAERIQLIFNRGEAPQSLDDADLGGHVDILPYSVRIVIQNKEELP